jgi:subtilisin family serine protease
MRKLIGVLVVLAATAAASPAAQASTVLPMELPQAAPGRAASSEPARWLVGARPGSRAARGIARRFGARTLRLPGTYAVPRARARGLAAALREAGVLTYAEPDNTLTRRSALDVAPGGWGRGAIMPGTLPPPAPALSVGIVDDVVDTTHPDVASQTRVLNGPRPVTGPHGTEVASAVSGLFNGSGVTGVFPGVPLLSYGLGSDITCADAVTGIQAVVAAGAKVINLSFGSATECFTLYRSVEAAYGAGILVVAAGGNEFLQGNPASFPAAWPHILSVAAVDQGLAPAFFSTANAAIDVAAPGDGIPLAVPLAFDNDGTPDGVKAGSGTSFAAPMVSGAAAWVWSARPELSNGQLADILRQSAQDVGDSGYDTHTGFGIIDVPRALANPVPRADPLEPNDEITFIDGTSFQTPDPYVWRGLPRPLIRASVDRVEDPVDVYRIQVPARRRAQIQVRTTFGDADLFVFRGDARTLGASPVARSERSGRATDAVTLTNTGRAARRFYIGIVPASRDTLNSAYTLQFRRLGRAP